MSRRIVDYFGSSPSLLCRLCVLNALLLFSLEAMPKRGKVWNSDMDCWKDEAEFAAYRQAQLRSTAPWRRQAEAGAAPALPAPPAASCGTSAKSKPASVLARSSIPPKATASARVRRTEVKVEQESSEAESSESVNRVA